MNKEWFRNDDFWRIFGRVMFLDDRFEAARDEIPDLINLAGIPIARVADLGCGPGRHAVPLAELGLAVTGIDLSEHLLGLGRELAAAHEANVDWVCEDMRTFSRPNHYDLVISMWTSFGYFDSPEDDLQVLRQSLHNLSSNGVLILDVVGKEYVTRNLQPVHLTEFEDGALLVERPILTERMTRYENEWLLIEGDRVHRAEWQHNLYSGRELEALVTAAGFDEVEIYGSLAGDDYDLDSERLVVVARKGD